MHKVRSPTLRIQPVAAGARIEESSRSGRRFCSSSGRNVNRSARRWRSNSNVRAISGP